MRRAGFAGLLHCSQVGAAPKGHIRLDDELPGAAMPLRFRSEAGALNFISTMTVFATPVDVTLQKLAVESLFRADAFTAQVLRQLTPGLAP